MIRQEINSFTDYFKNLDHVRDNKGAYTLEIENSEFNFSFILPFDYSTSGVLKKSVPKNVRDDQKISLSFKNCVFTEGLKISQNIEYKLAFSYCQFYQQVDLNKATFSKKVRFHGCDLYEISTFENTTFNDLADFWNSTFHKEVTFYKTDFNDTTVFSATTFRRNVLFTYTLFGKLVIFRGTNIEAGIDLSLAIITGDINIFNFKFDDYTFKSYKGIYKDVRNLEEYRSDKLSYTDAYQIIYDKAVTREHLIPIENKRETYRLLKSQLQSQLNYIDSIPYKVMENKTYLKESWQHLCSVDHATSRPISNILVLFLNGASNWFGSSYLIGLIFTIAVGSLFFNAMLSHIGDFRYTLNYNEWQWEYFVKFINPTHRFDFMKLIDSKPGKWFYIYDLLGRIFVGYGIYQTIQAFRKYK